MTKNQSPEKTKEPQNTWYALRGDHLIAIQQFIDEHSPRVTIGAPFLQILNALEEVHLSRPPVAPALPIDLGAASTPAAAKAEAKAKAKANRAVRRAVAKKSKKMNGAKKATKKAAKRTRSKSGSASKR